MAVKTAILERLCGFLAKTLLKLSREVAYISSKLVILANNLIKKGK